MKKLVMTLFLGITALSFANEEITEKSILNEVSALNTSYQELVEKEKARFLVEKERAEIAKEDLVKLTSLKEQIENTINNQAEERKKRFFKDDFDKLIKEYKMYLNDVNNEIDTKKKIISDFEVISQFNNAQ